MIEHFLGEEFEMDKLLYKVVLSDSNCFGCDLFYDDECVCMNYNWRFGVCSSEMSSDGQDVNFKFVREL